MNFFHCRIELLLYLHNMENKKRIEEGSTVFYEGMECLVVWSSTNYIDVEAKHSLQIFQGIHISKIN